MKSKRRWLGILIVFVILMAAMSYATVQTSTNDFCMSCHEMHIYQEEQMASSHAKDADGKPISCSQCHIPSDGIVRMLAAKSYMGAKDLWVHYTGNPYDLNRAEMQKTARRFIDDNNCRACHEDLTKNAKNEAAISLEGKLAHDAYLGKNGQSKGGCVSCHANVAHLPKFDQRIPKNAEFLAKIKENAEKNQ